MKKRKTTWDFKKEEKPAYEIEVTMDDIFIYNLMITTLSFLEASLSDAEEFLVSMERKINDREFDEEYNTLKICLHRDLTDIQTGTSMFSSMYKSFSDNADTPKLKENVKECETRLKDICDDVLFIKESVANLILTEKNEKAVNDLLKNIGNIETQN